jgi:imidazole glycerol phosphate synthase glutamine amidotransferase subunit
VTAIPDVVGVRTGTANLASVLAALERAGARPRLTSRPAEVSAARLLVLPGVGAFAAALAELDRQGLREALCKRIESGEATLCVCLGMQMLAESSEESPGVRGLGAIPCRVTRFGTDVRVPQLGWNRIDVEPGCQLLADGHVYFAHSFKLDLQPPGWRAAHAVHGSRFVAALERGNVLACQFHPELSGARGIELYRRWIRAGVAAC